MKTPDTSMRRPEAEALRDKLRAKGYLAFIEVDGICRTDADGNHFHAVHVNVRLDAKSARKLGVQ